MNQLEQTIVANARTALASLLHFYQNRKAKGQGNETTEEVDEHIGHFYTLHALLVFGHQANSGMSEEGMQALREIEDEHAAALRKMLSTAPVAQEVKDAHGVAANNGMNRWSQFEPEINPSKGDLSSKETPEMFVVTRNGVAGTKLATLAEVEDFLEACGIRSESNIWEAALAGNPVTVDDGTIQFIRQ
ncbi:hypothetical protein P245_19820 [Comamonas thiooxydans]|uniref:Uncharacterized protein n=2 Tax=Comamonas thiooxydans TaxID=363952 RepID=A0A0E3BAH3_9BURK|nr:hypothetical protein P245_19820 [Comamonas thiooxydans]